MRGLKLETRKRNTSWTLEILQVSPRHWINVNSSFTFIMIIRNWLYRSLSTFRPIQSLPILLFTCNSRLPNDSVHSVSSLSHVKASHSDRAARLFVTQWKCFKTTLSQVPYLFRFAFFFFFFNRKVVVMITYFSNLSAPLQSSIIRAYIDINAYFLHFPIF